MRHFRKNCGGLCREWGSGMLGPRPSYTRFLSHQSRTHACEFSQYGLTFVKTGVQLSQISSLRNALEKTEALQSLYSSQEEEHDQNR